jgi:hypothetical protein
MRLPVPSELSPFIRLEKPAGNGGFFDTKIADFDRFWDYRLDQGR